MSDKEYIRELEQRLVLTQMALTNILASHSYWWKHDTIPWEDAPIVKQALECLNAPVASEAVTIGNT